MNGKVLAACLATLALVAAVSAAPATTRLEKAVDEADLAFRAAAVDEVKAAASQIENAVAGGNGGGLLHSIMKAFGAPWKLIFGLFKGKGSSNGSASNAIAAAENLVNKLQRRRRDAPVAPEARLEKALTEADVAFRTALVDEMKKAEQSAVAAIGAGNGGGFMQSILEFLGSPFKLIAGLFKGKSNNGLALGLDKLKGALPPARRRRSPDGAESTAANSGDSKGTDGNNGVRDHGASACKPNFFQSIMKMFGLWSCPSSAASPASKSTGGASDSGADNKGETRS